MTVRMRSAGLVVEVTADGEWADLAREACAGQELPAGALAPSPDVRVRVVRPGGRLLDGSAALRPLARGAWSDGTTVVLADACSSGLDLALTPVADHLDVVATPQPTWRHRALGVAAPDRRVLLHRAALLQYPALWWAGVRGLVPLHTSAAAVRETALVVAGPGGVGKSTLLATVDAAGGTPVSDNLCVTDGRTVHGVLEPARRDDATGRRMPHGRREGSWPRLGTSLEPNAIVVLRRADQPSAVVRRLSPDAAARELVGGTYSAGELRRYWTFAATAALGTGLGPAHPPVVAVCELLASRVRAYELQLPNTPSLGLGELVDLLGTATGEEDDPAPLEPTEEVRQP
jgi:hypothetical protein